jgi:hypothetical protein
VFDGRWRITALIGLSDFGKKEKMRGFGTRSGLSLLESPPCPLLCGGLV